MPWSSLYVLETACDTLTDVEVFTGVDGQWFGRVYGNDGSRLIMLLVGSSLCEKFHDAFPSPFINVITRSDFNINFITPFQVSMLNDLLFFLINRNSWQVSCSCFIGPPPTSVRPVPSTHWAPQIFSSDLKLWKVTQRATGILRKFRKPIFRKLLV